MTQIRSDIEAQLTGRNPIDQPKTASEVVLMIDALMSLHPDKFYSRPQTLVQNLDKIMPKEV